MTGRTTNVAGQDIIPAQVERAQLTLRRTKTQDKRMSFGHQGSLGRVSQFIGSDAGVDDGAGGVTIVDFRDMSG
jgi:hypothetical protein